MLTAVRTRAAGGDEQEQVREAAIRREEENAAKLASVAAAGPASGVKHDWTHHFKAAREQPAAFRAAKPDPFVSPVSATPSALATPTPPRPSPFYGSGGVKRASEFTGGGASGGAGHYASAPCSPRALPYGAGGGGDFRATLPRNGNPYATPSDSLALLDDVSAASPYRRDAAERARRSSVPNLALPRPAALGAYCESIGRSRERRTTVTGVGGVGNYPLPSREEAALLLGDAHGSSTPTGTHARPQFYQSSREYAAPQSRSPGGLQHSRSLSRLTHAHASGHTSPQSVKWTPSHHGGHPSGHRPATNPFATGLLPAAQQQPQTPQALSRFGGTRSPYDTASHDFSEHTMLHPTGHSLYATSVPPTPESVRTAPQPVGGGRGGHNAYNAFASMPHRMSVPQMPSVQEEFLCNSVADAPYMNISAPQLSYPEGFDADALFSDFSAGGRGGDRRGGIDEHFFCSPGPDMV